MTVDDSLLLELISDAELIRQCHLQNSEVWKYKLSAEQYADREWICGVDHNPRDYEEYTGLFHFILRDISIPDDGSWNNFSNVVAACETKNRKGWRVEPHSELVDVIAICVGGVFTMPQHRKKGYAAKMIHKLNVYWEQRTSSKSFMFLYSEVGEYYKRFGYKSHYLPSHHINASSTEVTHSLAPGTFHYLLPLEFSELIEKQSNLLRRKLIEKSKTTDKTLVSLAMDEDTFTWFHKRDTFIASKLRPHCAIERFGAMIDDGSHDHIAWLHDWNDDELMVIALEFSDLNSFKALVNLAIKEAKDFELDHVTFWDSAFYRDARGELYNSVKDYICSLEGTKADEVNSSLPAIRFFDGCSNYFWENNEKWCWF